MTIRPFKVIRPDFTIDRTYRQPFLSPVERAFWVGMLVGAAIGGGLTWLLS